MANKRNYQRELEGILEQNLRWRRTPSLLLHACCAPCSSYVLEYLNEFFRITVFYYNPNITSRDEYARRVQELKRLTGEMPFVNPVSVIEGSYDPERFFSISRGLEKVPEGGERCFRCYRLRLEESARAAKEGGYDYFTTTLTISPLKNACKLNEIGEELSREYGVAWLPSDFKKKNGYKRSVELSAEYGLYRQNYCGCVFSQKSEVAFSRSCARLEDIANQPEKRSTGNCEGACD